MTGTNPRPHEVATDRPLRADATLMFIGRARTPWASREECPRQGGVDGPECRIELDPPWDAALAGIEAFETLDVLTWLDRSRRDLLVQAPRHGDGAPRGTFALRSPVRPNPIGLCRVRLVRRDGRVLVVRGLDCLDGTPLVDIKPDRCGFGPSGVDA
ncbi:MAG TPA: tRNA (N6-threonylcarbamoyladenosine(37)-N6)-methyltransferase TrmO [Amaricoccus sp.]|nr:tRNA (N6-threonylcarbamoyladenosine(37)-N6)-methyltransferase TrmO [Amaricoccus sp.]